MEEGNMKLKTVLCTLIILAPLSLVAKSTDCTKYYVPTRREYRKDLTEECKDFHYRGRKAFCRTYPREKLCPCKEYTPLGSKSK